MVSAAPDIALQRKLLELLTPRPAPNCPHAPEAPQQVFLLLSELEALYGGAAGGGKSDALLMGADQYTDIPGYAALLLRKTYSELSLPGALMDRSKEWWQQRASWDEGTHTWTFPAGSTITFGHLQHGNDRYRYQSAEFQYIGFDELTEFREDEYTFLISRGRRPSAGPLSQVPIRIRAATNPGGIGHEWVKSRFIPEINPVTLKRVLKRDERTGQLRPFIPAKLSDNPHIDRVQYVASLMHLDPVTRERLLNGDWDVHLGGMFSRLWFDIVPVAPIHIERQVRYWDLAATEAAEGTDPDYTATCRMARDKTTQEFFVLDAGHWRMSPMNVELLVKQYAETDGKTVPIFIEQEPGASSKLWIDHMVRQLAGWVVIPVPSRGSKPQRAAPLASQAEAGHIKLVNGLWIPEWLAELEAFSPEDDSPHDDQVDAASGAFQQLTSNPKARSYSTIPGATQPVYQRGDIRLVGERYVDKPPLPTRR